MREGKMQRIIYISHGASRDDWFVVEPQANTPETVPGPSMLERQVESLRSAGRGRRVIRLDTKRPYWPFTRVLSRGKR